MQENQHSSIPAAALRRPRRTGFATRGWVALGAALAVLFSAAGGYIAYANTLPTTVSLNVRDGEKDVPTAGPLVLRFTRPVALTTVESALTVTPTTPATLTAVLGQTEYDWAPTGPLAELTTYTVTSTRIRDLGHHPVSGCALDVHDGHPAPRGRDHRG